MYLRCIYFEEVSLEPYFDWCRINQFQVGQEIEIRPGIVSKDADGKLKCQPIFSKIVSLFAEHNDLQFAAPGGLIGECKLQYLFLKELLSIEFCLISCQ